MLEILSSPEGDGRGLVPPYWVPHRRPRQSCSYFAKVAAIGGISPFLWRWYMDLMRERNGPNRPAKRYLYFRFLITYLHRVNLGDVEWQSEIGPKSKMWASSGKYVRDSLLMIFAKKVGDYMFPEAFYNQTAFSEADCRPSRSNDEEETLPICMAHRVRNLMRI